MKHVRDSLPGFQVLTSIEELGRVFAPSPPEARFAVFAVRGLEKP